MWFVLFACTPAKDPGATSEPTSHSGSTTDTGTDTGTVTTSASDAALVQALVDGTATLEEVLYDVAWSGGWPVRDGTEAWFVVADDGHAWNVAGDFDGWSGTAMTAGDGFRWAKVDVGPDPEGTGYKFTDGADWKADPLARSYTYDAYGELSYVAAPTDFARLDRWPGLGGDSVGPRELRIHVPPGPGPFPILYAHDGQNLFDPNAIWGGWQLEAALGAREPMIVVGIDNTANRFEDYTHVPDDIGYGSPMGGNGDAYAAYVDDVVRPHVERVYGDPVISGVMGSSLGGLISLVIAQDRPGRYQFVASLSGTLGWGRFGRSEETIEERWLAAPPSDLVVYVDSGGDPGGDGRCVDVDGDGFSEDDPDASDNYCETRQFADVLGANGFTFGDTLFHWWEPGAEHNELAWASRVGPVLDHFLDAR